MSTALQYDRPDFRKVRRDAPCEACGKADWCMVSETTSWCMRNPDGAYATKIDAAGATVYLHHRTGAPAPLPFRAPRTPRTDAPDPATCAALYGALAALCAATPPPPAALTDERRRYGDHADGVRAVSDHFYLTPEHAADFLARLRAEGRIPAARAAGLVTGAPGAERLALVGRKVYPWRDGIGVRDLRGRAYLPTTGPKVLNLAGPRDERGCAHTFYRGDQLTAATDRRVVLAGGHEKADALAYAGELAIAANEGQLSPAQLDALAAARPALVVVFADGEDAPADQTHSAGQRLALAAAERLEARGLIAAVAEPPHAPGAKADADSVLRDHGPEALREMVRGAVPLAVYRRQIGADVQPPAAGQGTDLAALRADVARLGDQLRATTRELTETRDERDFYRRCLDCPDPVIGRALPAIAADLHRDYQAGSLHVKGGQEYARLNFERAEKGQAVKRGAITTAAERLASGTPRDVIPATYNRDGKDVSTKLHYFACPVEDRVSVARLGLGLLDRAAPQSKHKGRKPPKVMPPAVAEQTAPVRREQQHVERFYSLRDDTKLATVTTAGVTDYWTPDGEQITQEAAHEWQLAHGVSAAAVDTQHHYHAPPPRLFVGERPPARKGVETPHTRTNDKAVETQQSPPAEVVAGQCLNPDCTAPITQGGYCMTHYRAHAEAHRLRFVGDWDAETAADD